MGMKPRQKLHPETLESLKACNEAWGLVLKYFNDDADKASKWFDTANPQLGYITPRFMAMVGRGMKLLTFVKYQLEGNAP